MADITEDIEVKVAAETAQHFVDTYYLALSKPGQREHLKDFYLQPSPTASVDITMNGAVISDPATFQDMFIKQANKCHYEVQSFDCHVTNKNYAIGAPQGNSSHMNDGRRMSILVTVSGTAKYWNEDNSNADVKGFSDSVFLVPNWSLFGGKTDKRAKRWLIQNQTFRLVV